MDPLTLGVSTFARASHFAKAYATSQKPFDYFTIIDTYLDPECGPTELLIKEKYGLSVLAAFRLLLPALSFQVNHLDQHVIHGDDAIILEFRKSYIADCNMTSVAAAILAQVAITALSLPSLSQTHWIARALVVTSLTSGLLGVFVAVILQRTIGGMYEARALRSWLSSEDIFPNPKALSILRNTLRQISTVPSSYTSQRDAEVARAFLEDNLAQIGPEHRRTAVVSIVSASILMLPSNLINFTLASFLTGLGVYFGFLWTRDLDTDAGPNDSRNVFIVFIISTLYVLIIYGIPRGIKSYDEDFTSVYSILRAKIESINVNSQNQERNDQNNNPPPRTTREPSLDSDVAGNSSTPPGEQSDSQSRRQFSGVNLESQSSTPSVEEHQPEIGRPSQNSNLNAALRRAMEAHRELSAAELALSKEYAKILADTEIRGNTSENIYDEDTE